MLLKEQILARHKKDLYPYQNLPSLIHLLQHSNLLQTNTIPEGLVTCLFLQVNFQLQTKW